MLGTGNVTENKIDTVPLFVEFKFQQEKHMKQLNSSLIGIVTNAKKKYRKPIYT